MLDWQIGPEPAVTIGVVEGEGPLMLHRVGDATKLPDGRIVIAETSSSELKVFDSTGTYLETWGGMGEGPGEFPSYMLQEGGPGGRPSSPGTPGLRSPSSIRRGTMGARRGPGVGQASWQSATGRAHGRHNY